MHTLEEEYSELLAKYKLLEVENHILSERSEDAFLLSRVSESINFIEDESILIENVLEKIAVLKNIPFCGCIQLKDGKFDFRCNFFLYSENTPNKLQIVINNDLYSHLGSEGIVFLNKSEIHKGSILIDFKSVDFSPNSVLLIKCNNQILTPGIFIFMDEVKNEIPLIDQKPLLTQIVNIVNDKLDKINLVKELSELNKDLDNRVKLRTIELNNTNERLKNEIAEREKITVALVNSEKRYRELFNKANDAIYLWQIDDEGSIGKLLEVNEVASEMLGFTKEEFLDLDPMAYISPESAEQLPHFLRQLIKYGHAKSEFKHLDKQGKEIPVEINSHFFINNDQKFALSIVRDISDRKLAEMELMRKNADLIDSNLKLQLAKQNAEDSDRLKTAFLANISHEIRTPLNGIIGFSNLLSDQDLSTESKRSYLDVINSSANQLINIINDIIDISQIESNQVNLKYAPCDINCLIDEIYLLYLKEKSEQIGNGLDFSVFKELEGDTSITRTDEYRLRQILINLVDNAFKCTPNGHIRFGYRIVADNINKEFIRFFVEDSGIGIKAEYQNQIFERFMQGDTDTRKWKGGTGLGLSISKGLVELLGGTIWLDSKPGEGSVFYFTVPYEQVKAFNMTDDSQNPGKNSPFEWSDKSILIVEDEYSNFLYLSTILENTKVKQFHAADGKEAFEMFRDIPQIDLILMDIRLPFIDGLEATKMIREKNKSVPIIAQTAYAMPDDRQLALEAGCNDYISKPVTRFSLLQLISEYFKI